MQYGHCYVSITLWGTRESRHSVALSLLYRVISGPKITVRRFRRPVRPSNGQVEGGTRAGPDVKRTRV